MNDLINAMLAALLVMLCLGALVCVGGLLAYFSTAMALLFGVFVFLTFTIYCLNN